MPKQVTDEQIDKLIEGMTASFAPHLEESGVQGVTSRCMNAALPHMARWSAGEFNRATPPDQTVQALMVLTANALASELENVPCSIDVKVDAINEFLRELAQNTLRILTNKTPGTFAHTEAQEVGHG